MNQQTIKDVQSKILETMIFIDNICRTNKIIYYIMGGTALGAVRHGGFIPWDDDLDIFMTPDNYEKFKIAFSKLDNDMFVLQEWRIVANYLEYAKIRMNGTTFIENIYKERKDFHHGIYVDIMILHKCPNKKLVQKAIYIASKYVTLVALSQRNWKAKTLFQAVSLKVLKILPNRFIANQSYKLIYRYENLYYDFSYCYFITKAKFNQGIFNQGMFGNPKDITFEHILLMGPTEIEKYLEFRYGDYMKLPSEEQQKVAIHADIYDVENDYKFYL
jgi:lipopolysaccharide cholinephosphotransferase